MDSRPPELSQSMFLMPVNIYVCWNIWFVWHIFIVCSWWWSGANLDQTSAATMLTSQHTWRVSYLMDKNLTHIQGSYRVYAARCQVVLILERWKWNQCHLQIRRISGIIVSCKHNKLCFLILIQCASDKSRSYVSLEFRKESESEMNGVFCKIGFRPIL